MAFSLDTKKVLDYYGYVPARESNGKYSYQCPLHNEHHGQSFHVYPDGGWTCFGKCGVSGGAVKFISLLKNIPMSAAIREAETIFGIKINFDDRKDKYAALYEINRRYADLFHAELIGGKHPDLIKYLAERGISREAVDRWNVGYFHKDLAMQKPEDYELLSQAGILLKKDRYMSAFGFEKDGRIIFPITDFDGDTVAFSARINPFSPEEVKKEYAKYINTGTTPIFEKKFSTFGYVRNLYDLIKDFQAVVVVEGAVDALILQEQLIPGVALLGLGSNSPESTELLTKFTKKIILFLDGDDAGFNRIIKMAKGSLFEVIERNPQIEIGVAFPPLGKDPDEYVLENRSACYETLKNAVSLEEYVFQQIVGKINAQTTFPLKRTCLFKEFAETLRSYPRSMRKHYLKELEKQTDLEVYEELNKDLPTARSNSSVVNNSYNNQRPQSQNGFQQNNRNTNYPVAQKSNEGQNQVGAVQGNPPVQAAAPNQTQTINRRKLPPVKIVWRKYPHLLLIKEDQDLLTKANYALAQCGFKELSFVEKTEKNKLSPTEGETKKINWLTIRSSFINEYLRLLTDLGSRLGGQYADPLKMLKLKDAVMADALLSDKELQQKETPKVQPKTDPRLEHDPTDEETLEEPTEEALAELLAIIPANDELLEPPDDLFPEEFDNDNYTDVE